MDLLNYSLVQGHEQTVPTNLCDGHQIRHVLKIIGREISVTPRLDLHQSLVDLCTEFLLTILIFGKVPEPKGELKNP